MIESLRSWSSARWRLLAHIGAVIPLMTTLWHLIAGDVADPVADVIHDTGRGALKLLIATLSVSPLIRWGRLGRALPARRTLGLWCFSYVCIHAASWFMFDQGGQFELALRELASRLYLTLGMAAFGILLLLAVTSSQYSQRRLRRHWQQLHNGIYLVALMAPLHYWMSLKSPQFPPVAYGVVLLALLGLRWRKILRR